MKLGTQTASLVNHLESCGVIGQPEPVVGMGATILGWSDRHPATVIEVFTVGKSVFITVQEDNAKVVSGSTQNGSAEYEFSRNPNGIKNTFKRANNGKWIEARKNEETGRWNTFKSRGLKIGQRSKYYDPHF